MSRDFAFNTDAIFRFCKDNYIKDYIINDDFSIEVIGDVYFIKILQTHIGIKIRKINGSLHVSDSRLTTLFNFQDEVTGNVTLVHNKLLNTLEHMSQIIGGNFKCIDSPIVNLIGAPREINGSFIVYAETLSNLHGIPKIINGDLILNDNINLDNLDTMGEKCLVSGSIHIGGTRLAQMLVSRKIPNALSSNNSFIYALPPPILKYNFYICNDDGSINFNHTKLLAEEVITGLL